jgi:hypothetical protein
MVFKGKRWYLVKKIFPERCPYCQIRFWELEQGSFSYRFQEKPSRIKEVCCNNCFGWSKIFILEEKVVREKEEAELLVKQGFTGFILVSRWEGFRKRLLKKG